MKNVHKKDWIKILERFRTLILLPVFLLMYACVLHGEGSALKTGPSGIVFNEVCTSNYRTIQNGSGKWQDYIELYNCSDTALNLQGYSITLGKSRQEQIILQDTTLYPGQYMILFPMEIQEKTGGGSSFQISSEQPETLYLYSPEGVLSDTVSIPPLTYDTAYAREIDGYGDWQLLSPTPGKSNQTASVLNPESLSAPVLSHASGFYESDISLTMISAPGTEIYYTTDGSMPDENSLHYTAPIQIGDNSKNPDVYADRKDVSSAFLTQEIAQYTDSLPPRFQSPSGQVDKCTLIRCICIDQNGQRSAVTTHSYFIGYDEKSGYDNLPVISLITEPENLFDDETGIYVLGEDFRQARENGLNESWIFWPANYYERGRQWERPAYVSLFSKDKELAYETYVGLRIKGASSRVYPQKSFLLNARKELSGSDTLSTMLLTENYETDSITLSNSGNDYYTKLKDYLISRLMADRSFDVMEYAPCAVFLNGEYWGIYYLAENYNEAYFKEHYHVSLKDLALIKNMEVKYGTEEDYEALEDLMVFACENDLSLPENYEKLSEELDMQNYTEYIAAQTYIAHHGDWPQKNTALWRTRSAQKGRVRNPYADSKWRWILFDVNSVRSAMNADLADYNMFPVLEKYEYFYPALIKNADFKKQFALTLQDMMNLDFSMDRVNEEIDAYLALMEEPMEKYYDRYFGGNDGTFQQEVEDIRLFFENRPACLLRHMKESGLAEGELSELTLQLNDAEGGRILLNGNEVPFENGIWKGQYYTDYPLTVEAAPEKGYRFAGWEGDAASSSEITEISLPDEGIVLKAVFEKK